MKNKVFANFLIILFTFFSANSITLAKETVIPASSQQQYASYVIISPMDADKNIAIARTVIKEALLCPSVSVVGDKDSYIPMITRENPNHFSVLVCEALIQFDTAYQINFSDTAIKLPIAKSNPQSIKLFGDTGCKAPKPGKAGGCPKGTPAEPFKSLADAAAADQPDLVLHVGDFNYRGTSGKTYFTQTDPPGRLQQVQQWPYDAGDGSTESLHCEQIPNIPFYSQSAKNSNYPDIWKNWHDDLFKPAQKLFAAAPWVVTRGNHELCSRAGAGYFYFLAPQSNLLPDNPQLSCPEPQVERDAFANTVQVPSYKLSFKALDIVVFDSANACDSFADSPFTRRFEKVFSDIETMVKDKPTWLMTHRPIWGITQFYPNGSTACDSSQQYGCVNQMMQAAIQKSWNRQLPDAINLVVGGHMHRFQSVSFAPQKRPPQLIVGSSGVALDHSPPDGVVSSPIDGLAAQIISTNNTIYSHGTAYDAFAYFSARLNQDGSWHGKIENPAKKLTIAHCSSRQDKAQGVCELAPNISVVK